jgi:putative DNA primase/helicase
LPTGSDASTDPWALPQSVRERFVQERRRFYFPDGTEAFRDRGRRLTTGSENTEVVRSLVEIAQTRGWGEIVVEGSERFRREAWRQARLADLEVRGYRPTVAERAALARALARKADGAQLELDVSDRGEEGRGHGPGERRASAAPAAPAEARVDRSGGGARNRLLEGTLLDHGREHYRFDPQEDLSYFVRIRNAEGTRTIWGKDLERAITHSLTQPAIGDAVGLRRVGGEQVTVRRRERDADGQVIGEHALGAERSRWVIEHRGFFEERAAAAALVRDGTVNRKAVAGAHPELVGTFLQLRAAELAARRLRDPPDQQRFVALVRGALADAVERGDPLQPVRLRNRPARTPQRAPRAQEAEPVR